MGRHPTTSTMPRATPTGRRFPLSSSMIAHFEAQMTRGPRQLNGFDLHSMVFSPMTICDANGWRTDKAFISITHSDEKPGDPPRPCLLPEPFRQPCRGRHQHGARAPHDPRFPRFDLHPVAFPFLRRVRLLRLRFLLPDALRNRPTWLFLFQHSVPLM